MVPLISFTSGHYNFPITTHPSGQMFSPWFFWLFSSWQGQLPQAPSMLFLSWSKSLSLLYISLALSWDGFISHCFILSCVLIFTHKVNVHIDKATAFLWVPPVIRKEIIQTCHVLFLRSTHDPWKYFMYLYPLCSQKDSGQQLQK